MPTKTTREKLYAEVWERPMIKVAADYGISDVGLKKICKKYSIPVPGRGYWAKLAAGKSVSQTKLPDSSENNIVISGVPINQLPTTVSEAKYQAEIFESLNENIINIDQTGYPMHSLITNVRSKLEKKKADKQGLVHLHTKSLFWLSLSPTSLNRTTTFLNAFVHESEKRGFGFKTSDDGLNVVVDDVSISLSIEERLNKTPHNLTEHELNKIKRWEKSHSYLDDSPWKDARKLSENNISKWDYSPNGKLLVKIDQHYNDGIRRRFIDAKNKKIENFLNQIMVSLVATSAAAKERQIEAERRHQEYLEQQRRWEEAQKKKEIEEIRVKFLANCLDDWKNVQNICAFIDDVAETATNESETDREAIINWVSWARDYSNRLNPINRYHFDLEKIDQLKLWELRSGQY